MNLDKINEISKKYRVSENLSDKFDNIMRFSKNMTLKDSRYFEKSEDPISREFGNLLIKYYDEGLNNSDIVKLLAFVKNYNDAVSNQLNNSALFKMSAMYGLPYDILESFVEDINNGVKYDNIKYDNLLSSNIYEGSLLRLIILSFLEDNKNSSLTESAILRIFGQKILENISANKSTSIFKDFSLVSKLDKTLNTYLSNKGAEIESLEKAFLDKLKIHITGKVDKDGSISNDTDKRSASSAERSMAESGDHLSFFDIKLYKANLETFRNVLSVIPSDGTKINDPQFIRSETVDISFQILYKELNTAYRDILESDMIEVVTSLLWETKIKSNILNKRNSISQRIQDSVRSIRDNIFIRDFYDEDGNIKGTTKLFKYRYTNPYLSRRAAESELISYYIGDEYISNKYGVYTYEKLEITRFIEILKEVREYFYRVLMNESFVNEEEYFAYERLFITFLAVIRFIDSTLEYTRDIDSFSRRDIENFLESFGLGSLSSILDTGDFINSESYAKSIIKKYINLMQNKGSRAVINDLQEAFSIGATELVIYKNLLVGIDEEKEEEDGKKNVRRKYAFFKVKYESTDILNTLINGQSTDMDEFTESDKYWNTENTDPELLTSLNINASNTKYLIPELTNELSEVYLNTRILFAITDAIFNKYTYPYSDSNNNDNININNISMEFDYINGASCSLQDYINSIRYLWKEFITAKIEENGGDADYIKDKGYNIVINTTKIRQYSDIFEWKITETNTGESSEKTVSYENKFSVKDDAFNKIISGYHLTEGQSNFFKNMLEYLAPLVSILCYDPDNNSVITDDMKKNNYRFTRDDVFSSVFLGSINFVRSFLIGSVLKQNLPYELYKYLLDLYTNIFFAEGNYYTLYTETDKDSYIFNESIEIGSTKDIMNAIAFLCNELSGIFGVILGINLSGKDDLLIQFLRKSIEYFISYTTEIYKFIFKNSFNSYTEECIAKDGWRSIFKYTELDSMFYDEQLKFELTTNESPTNNNGGNNE